MADPIFMSRLPSDIIQRMLINRFTLDDIFSLCRAREEDVLERIYFPGRADRPSHFLRGASLRLVLERWGSFALADQALASEVFIFRRHLEAIIEDVEPRTLPLRRDYRPGIEWYGLGLPEGVILTDRSYEYMRGRMDEDQGFPCDGCENCACVCQVREQIMWDRAREVWRRLHNWN